MSIETLYTSGVNSQMGNYYANWQPSSPLKLGDFGVLRGDLFERHGNIEMPEINISLETVGKIIDNDPGQIDLSSQRDVKITAKIAGEVSDAAPYLPKAKASIGVEFSKEGAFVIKANKSYEDALSNLVFLKNELIELIKKGIWENNYYVVVQLVRCEYADILISRKSDTKLILTTEADVEMSKVSLGNAEVKFELAVSSGQVYNYLNQQNITPLFRIARIRRRLFGGPILKAAQFHNTDVTTIDLVRNPELVNQIDLEIL